MALETRKALAAEILDRLDRAYERSDRALDTLATLARIRATADKRVSA